MKTLSKKRRPQRAQRAKRPPEEPRLEWIGGRLRPPFFVTDREEPSRAEIVVWMEVPSGVVVGQKAIRQEDAEGVLCAVLLAALDEPLVGPRRRPDAIRVADATLAEEARSAVGDEIPVTVAPTPEIDEFLEFLLQSSERDPDKPPRSYLEGGRISPDTVARLFSAARALYALRPWKMVDDSQVLRMDIPALGIEGACLSIIGALEQSYGVVIFPSLAGYDAFSSTAGRPRTARRLIDAGTDWIALTFERGADLPPSMLSETVEHGWPVANADAYPLVEHRDRDGARRPLVPRDLEIATACASALTAFLFRNEHLFKAERFKPVSMSFFDRNEREVRFTVPYEAFSMFETGNPEPARKAVPGFRPRASRNAPCPCGSGKKYKKCHLPLDQAEHVAAAEAAGGGSVVTAGTTATGGAPVGGRAKHASPLHDLDDRMVRTLLVFADEHFGDAWRRHELDFEDLADPDLDDDEPEVLQLAIPWSVYAFRVDGRTVAEAYLDRHGRRCTAAERAWLAAQGAAWLSVWEVIEVEQGRSLTLIDLLSGERRQVQEATGSMTLVTRDALLARVVDHEDVSLLCGSHPRVLRPLEAAEVVRLARGRLRRKRAVPVERLKDEAFGRYLIRRWEEIVAEAEERALTMPDLQNTDGDPLLLTTDHFTIQRGERREVEARLGALPDVEPPHEDDEEPSYDFLRPGNPSGVGEGRTLIGRAIVSRDRLRLETNSIRRADAILERIEVACEGLVRHRGREHADPRSPAAREELGAMTRRRGREATKSGAPGPGAAGPEAPPPPEVLRRIADWKRKYYAEWLDMEIPALGGKTPREAARTAKGRAALDVLLKDMENHEHHLPEAGGEPFDFSGLRHELGIE